jgi:hypothetical protein
MKKTGIFVSFGLLIGALLLAACAPAVATASQSSSSHTGNPAPVVPESSNATGNCSLITKDNMGTILGETVTEVRDEASSTICAYQTQNMIMEVNFLNTGGLSATQFMDAKRSINPDSVVPVAGLGDDAFYSGNATYMILQVRTGSAVNTFGLRSADGSTLVISAADAQAKELAAAQLLIPRLH